MATNKNPGNFANDREKASEAGRDVYKRQVLIVEYCQHPLRVLPFAPVLGHGDQLSQVVHLHGAVTHQADHRTVRVGELGGDGIGPVSYTHLDVYKRQQQMLPAERTE